MAGLDFFGSGPALSGGHSHSRPTTAAPRKPAAAPPATSTAARPGSAGVAVRSVGSSAGRSASGSPSVPPSPLRGPAAGVPGTTSGLKSSSASPRPLNGQAATSLTAPRPLGSRSLSMNAKVASPAQGAAPSPGPSVAAPYRPVTVVVRTVAAKAKSSAAAVAASTNGGAQLKYNALPEERRLRIAQEREQREREQAEKAYAERNRAQGPAQSSGADRPLKKRRTASTVSEGKKRSPSLSSNGENTRRRARRARNALSDDDEEEDADLFGTDTTSPRTARESAKDEWIVPPRQPRNVVREDEVEAVKLAMKDSFKADGGAPSMGPDALQGATGDHAKAGINSAARSFQAISSMDVVNQAGIKTFAPYFRDIDDFTTVTLEYPAMHASETFPLLVPKPLDEYDPISDLLRTVHVMVSSYFPNEEVRRRLFGKLEELEPTSGRLHPRDASSPLPMTSSLSGQITPNGSAGAMPNGHTLSPLTSIASGASTPMRISASSSSQSIAHSTSADRLATPQPSGFGGTPTPISTPNASSSAAAASDGESILRSFQRARNRRNGPLFLRTIARFNETMRKAKREGVVLEGIRAMSESGIPERLWATIHDQCYSRVVGPQVEALNEYEAFSDNVYGELLPRFSAEIAHLTGLGPSSVFVDMGSGVGNVLVQLALQTGCAAYGCEMMETPATLAHAQIEEARARWAMWGLKGGEVEAWKDNFCTNENVGKVLRKADVVLVNNYAFTPATNDKLVLQFLDLKDGCHIISLKPFVPPDFRLTERTLSSPLAILRVVERAYSSGSVSWANGGGRYFIHTVDRKIVQDFRPSKHTRGDTRKRRWKRNVEEEDDDMMSM